MYLDIINRDGINNFISGENIEKYFSKNGYYYKIIIYRYNKISNAIALYEWNGYDYQTKMSGEFKIEHQLDGTSKILITQLISIDRNTIVLYFKGQNGIGFIKSVYCKNNYPTNYPTSFKYVIEQSNATCQNEFESLCNQQYYNEDNCVLIVKVNGIGEPQIVINKNGIELINSILKQQVQKSDGFNYGLYNQLNYNWIML